MDNPTTNDATPTKEFSLVTTSQVERTYIVQAEDSEQAHARLRTYLKDADMLKPGVVTERTELQKNTTGPKIKSNVEIPTGVHSDPPPGSMEETLGIPEREPPAV